ncbi:hypothetical protein Cni_G01952 [Canna indica]|uniref:Pectinesterase inhibitor domain-containing protein n=1 Tax=Canna indica TaxID=4628 RepID=A0AAQ3JQ48_9LILI|nr:hypothetical protein Cni_G01952 [Canna indica]
MHNGIRPSFDDLQPLLIFSLVSNSISPMITSVNDENNKEMREDSDLKSGSGNNIDGDPISDSTPSGADLTISSPPTHATEPTHRNPILLGRVTSNITLARLCALCVHVSTLRYASMAATRREAAALRDFADALGDAADQVGRTTAELRGLEALAGMEVAWRVSNALTGMDSFGEVSSTTANTDLKSDMCHRVRRVKQYTSNALALVSSLVREC